MIKLRQRLSNQEGFTLIELLIVIVIIGILLAIAVPSYLGFKDRANRRAAQSDVRESIPTAEAFYSDHGTYSNMSLGALKLIDSGISAHVKVSGASQNNYCLGAQVGNKSYSAHGPGATWHSGDQSCQGSVVSLG